MNRFLFVSQIFLRTLLCFFCFMVAYCYPWGASHHTITKKAIEILPEEDRNFLGEEAIYLWRDYCGFPDMNWGWYGGFGAWNTAPDQPRFNDVRRYYNISFYCGWDPVLQKGKFYAHKAPESYECCPIYLEKAIQAFREGKILDGACFLGVLAHYIEDTGAFPHYQKLHKHCEDGMEYSKIGAPGYQPKLLGKNISEAQKNLKRELENLVEYTETFRQIIESRVDKKEKKIPEFLNCANACVRVVADAIYTAIELSGKPKITVENPINKNLIFNSGFEEDNEDFVPKGWVSWYNNRIDKIGRAVYVNRKRFSHGFTKSGRCSVKLMWTPKEGIEWRQRWPYTVSVKEGEKYRVSGWIKTMQATGNNYLALRLFQPGKLKKVIKSHSFQGNNDWQEVSFEVTIPKDITRIGIACCSEGNEGAVWFDDIKLFRLPPSDSTKSGVLEKNVKNEVKKIIVRLSRNYFEVGEKGKGEILFYNKTKEIQNGTLVWQILDPSNHVVYKKEKPLNLKILPDKIKKVPFSFLPTSQSEYKMVVNWNSFNINSTEEIPIFGMYPDPGPAPTGKLKLKLVSRIDCCESLDKSKFVDDGTSKIINSDIGTYREAGLRHHSRFAYKINFPKIQVPYLISVTYPEDKPRTMEINYMIDGPNRSIRDAERGIMCGDEYPLDNKFKKHRFFVWPRTKEAALVFMTLEDNHPAAAKSIEIYEVIGGRLPALKINSPEDLPERRIGIYFEDPTFFKDFGAIKARSRIDYTEFPTAVDRLFDYLDYTGQNLFMYPVIFYEGPGFPSRVEPYDVPFYGMFRRHPYNFFEYLLRRAEKRGITLFAIANFMEIPSLKFLPKPDVNAVLSGKEDTFYNVDYKNRIQLSWKPGRWNLMYNLFHPLVQEKLLNYLKDLVDYYADYKSFGGLALRIHENSCCWMGDLSDGYNDFTINQFEKDTGIKIPVSKTDPERFSKRYNWLIRNKKEEWINWRCKKLSKIYIELAHYMKERRNDLTLIFTFIGPWKRRAEVTSGKMSYIDYLREGGIDIEVLKNLDNVNFQFTLIPANYRYFRAHKKLDDTYRILNFKPEIYKSFPQPFSINIHDTYWEDDIGKKRPLPDFWFEERTWRVSVVNPSDPYVLEVYAIPLILKDYKLISKGGYSVGTTAIEDAIRRFTRAFRTIPREDFIDIPTGSDAVALRYWQNYFYVVNGSSSKRQLTINFSTVPIQLIDLVTEESVKINNKKLILELSPYELRSFKCEKGLIKIRNVVCR